MANGTDRELLEYVNKAINSGCKSFGLPTSLLQSASKEAIEEVRRLCKINGVEFESVID